MVGLVDALTPCIFLNQNHLTLSSWSHDIFSLKPYRTNRRDMWAHFGHHFGDRQCLILIDYK